MSNSLKSIAFIPNTTIIVTLCIPTHTESYIIATESFKLRMDRKKKDFDSANRQAYMIEVPLRLISNNTLDAR